MVEFAALLSQLGPLHWWGLAAALVGLEMVMPTQYLLWPGLAALVTGILVLLVPSLGVEYQFLVFAVLSAISVATVHYWPKTAMAAGEPKLNQRMSGYVGRQAVVAEAFTGVRGTIILDDTRWVAETVDGKPLPSRTMVEIVGVDGTVLKVRPV